MKQLALDLARPAAPTLDNFVPGANGELLAALRAIAAGAAAERFVYVWGGAGCGRTHLLTALAAATGAHYVACASALALPADLGTQPLAAVDDVDALDESAQIALFNAYNEMRANGGALVAAGSRPPTRLALRADLATRLAWGLVYEVRPLSDDERREALTRHAAQRGFALAPDVANYLLAHARRDLPTLLAILDALDRHSLETRRPVSVLLARELLRDAAPAVQS